MLAGSEITPLYRMDNEFRLASGFFVLNENVMRGDVPRHDAQLFEIYKKLDSLARKAYYAAVKHCVSTPFGYWVSDTGRPALEEEIAELQAEAESYNLLAGDDFRAIINFVYVRSDPNNEILRRRMPGFLAERLEAVKQKLIDLDPETDKKALVYTQDQTKRLHTMVTGRIGALIQRAGESARAIAHEIKTEPSKKQSMDFSSIDEAIGVLREVEAGVAE